MKARPRLITFIVGGVVILCACVALSAALGGGRRATPAATASPAAPVSAAAAAEVTFVPEVTILAAATAAPTAAPRGYVSRAMFGDAWPFTIEEGMLQCTLKQAGDRVYQRLVMRVGDQYYAVNGIAAGEDTWRKLEEIWADDPRMAGLKISMQPILDAGLALCPTL